MVRNRISALRVPIERKISAVSHYVELHTDIKKEYFVNIN